MASAVTLVITTVIKWLGPTGSPKHFRSWAQKIVQNTLEGRKKSLSTRRSTSSDDKDNDFTYITDYDTAHIFVLLKNVQATRTHIIN